MSDSLRPHGLLHTRLLLSSTISQSLLKFMSTELVILSNHLIFCFCLSLLSSPFPSRVFSNKLALHIRWPKYWSFSFSNNSSSEYSVLISFKIDWLHCLAVQGTLKSLIQHHSLKASVLRCSASFMVQLSHPCVTTGKRYSFFRFFSFIDYYKMLSIVPIHFNYSSSSPEDVTGP